MSSEWRQVTLKECVELTTGYPFKSASYSDETDGIRLLRGDNIAQGILRWDGVKFWPAKDAQQLGDYQLKVGDIVLAMDRPWISVGLKFSSVRRSDLPALLVQRVARIRPTEDVDASFLHCVIGSPSFSHYIQAVSTGTAVPHISAKQITDYRFNLPSLKKQRLFGSIVMALDDRITLLRETNKTLESIAQVIFKSWFVDFDPVHAKAKGSGIEGIDAATAALFPNSFEETEAGLIPKGWAKKSLDEIAQYLNGLALQKFPPDGVNDLPVIKIAQLRKGDTIGADKASRNLKSEYIIQNGDVLFSWSGSLEVEIWCGGEGALNQHLFKVTSIKFSKWFYYLWTRHHLAEFRQVAASKATTMGHIQRSHLTAAKVIVPSDIILEAANNILQPIIEQIILNATKAKNLTDLRDTLLPRLMSGQIRIEEAQEMVESV